MVLWSWDRLITQGKVLHKRLEKARKENTRDAPGLCWMLKGKFHQEFKAAKSSQKLSLTERNLDHIDFHNYSKSARNQLLQIVCSFIEQTPNIERIYQEMRLAIVLTFQSFLD